MRREAAHAKGGVANEGTIAVRLNEKATGLVRGDTGETREGVGSGLGTGVVSMSQSKAKFVIKPPRPRNHMDERAAQGIWDLLR